MISELYAAKSAAARGEGPTGAVGIWHETYAVQAGAHESLYVGMPPTGLGKAFGLTEDRSRRRHARIGRNEVAAAGVAPEGAVS